MPEANAHQVWISLVKIFYDNQESKLMQLEKDLRNITMGDLSVLVYFSKIQNLSSLICNIDAESKVNDKNLVKYAINGLSTSFEYISTTIHYCKLLPSFQEMQSMLLFKEQCLLVPQNAPNQPDVDYSLSR